MLIIDIKSVALTFGDHCASTTARPMMDSLESTLLCTRVDKTLLRSTRMRRAIVQIGLRLPRTRLRPLSPRKVWSKELYPWKGHYLLASRPGSEPKLTQATFKTGLGTCSQAGLS